MERRPETLCVDQDRRRDPRNTRRLLSTNQRLTTLDQLVALGGLARPVAGWPARTGSATGPGYLGRRARVPAPTRRVRDRPSREDAGRQRRTRRADRECGTRQDRSIGHRLRQGWRWSSTPLLRPSRRIYRNRNAM